MRLYRVKTGHSIQHQNATYIAGMLVELDAESAYFHQEDIEPFFDIPDDPAPPFEARILAQKGQDFEQTWVFESYTVDIDSITPGPASTIITKIPHQLANGSKINLRFNSSTTFADLRLIATIVDSITFTVPQPVTLPSFPEYAEIGVPLDLSGSTFAGGIYNYLTQVNANIFTGTFYFTSGSKRVEFISTQQENKRLLTNDLLTCSAAGLSDIQIVSLSNPLELSPGVWKTALLLASSATSTISTADVVTKTTEVLPNIGSEISGAVFNFTTVLDYGIVTAKADKTVIDLLSGILPFKIQRTDTDEIFILGTIEVNS